MPVASASADVSTVAMTPAVQRSRGDARVRLARDSDGATQVAEAFQEGATKVRFPANHDGPSLQAVLVNTAGGVTGGDRYTLDLTADAGTDAALTTQACEKVYRAVDGVARIDARVGVGTGARFAWLPQETIVYDGGRLRRTLEVELAGDATFLGVESFVLGRTAMGETFRAGAIHDRWMIRRAGRLVFADALRITGDIDALRRGTALLAGARAFATLVWLGDDPERLVAPVRAAIGDDGGASAFDGKLVARLLCADGMVLRSRLTTALGILDDGRALPRVWRV